MAVVSLVAVLVIRQQSSADTTDYAVTVGTDTCANSWNTSTGGPLSFTITNNASVGIEVFIENVDTKKLYLEVQGLGAGATRTQQVSLGNGRYRFDCLPVDNDALTGPVVTISGVSAGTSTTPGLVPVTNNDLIPVLQAYHGFAATRLETLRTQVAAIAAAAGKANRPAAERAWLTAQITFDKLGGAYDAFDEAGNKVLGTATTPHTEYGHTYHYGLVQIETQLWHGGSLSTVATTARTLGANIAALRKNFATTPIQARDIGLRVHEILENSLQWDLRGRTDHGSGDTMALVSAKIGGSRYILGLLTPIVKSRYPGLGAAAADLNTLQALVNSFHSASGWRPWSALTTAQRERVDALTDQALEALAPIATITEPRTVLP